MHTPLGFEHSTSVEISAMQLEFVLFIRLLQIDDNLVKPWYIPFASDGSGCPPRWQELGLKGAACALLNGPSSKSHA